MASPIDVLLTPEAIAMRVSELGTQIAFDCREDEKPISMIVVACGALVFASDLMRSINASMTLDLVLAKSYKGRESSGKVVSELCFKESLKGRTAILVDDILDSGRTLSAIKEEVEALKPASLKTCVLLDKPSRRVVDISADYAGFIIPDSFVVGYGLDFDGLYRNLPFVGVLRDEPSA